MPDDPTPQRPDGPDDAEEPDRDDEGSAPPGLGAVEPDPPVAPEPNEPA